MSQIKFIPEFIKFGALKGINTTQLRKELDILDPTANRKLPRSIVLLKREPYFTLLKRLYSFYISNQSSLKYVKAPYYLSKYRSICVNEILHISNSEDSVLIEMEDYKTLTLKGYVKQQP